MKNTFLKINKPCSEHWQNMTPNERGRFCDICAKNVIDFTKLSQAEISKKVQSAKGEICARVTKQQLETPLLHLEVQKKYKLPYSNMAASILLASTMAVSTSVQAQQQPEKTQTEVVQKVRLSSKSNIKRKQSKPATKPSGFVTFTGKVEDNDKETPIEGAEIMFVTLQKMYVARSQKDGTFSMEIPVEFVDDANVIRVSYHGVDLKREPESYPTIYETTDYILSKKELTSTYVIKAVEEYVYMGGISSYSEKIKPVIVYNGERIQYKSMSTLASQEKTKYDFSNKVHYHFNSRIAMAIYGEEAKDGLYIILDKPTK